MGGVESVVKLMAVEEWRGGSTNGTACSGRGEWERQSGEVRGGWWSKCGWAGGQKVDKSET